MQRLIDANKLITTIQGTTSEVARTAPYDPEWFTRLAQRQFEIIRIIDEAKTVDAVEVVHGRWEFSHTTTVEKYEVVKCSNCGHEAFAIAIYVKEGNYCPNCGAKMDGDGNVGNE